MQGNQFATLHWNTKPISLYIVINDTDLCEVADHVNDFSIFINSDLTRLDKSDFWTQLDELCYFSDRPPGGATDAVLRGDLVATALYCVRKWKWMHYS